MVRRFVSGMTGFDVNGWIVALNCGLVWFGWSLCTFAQEPADEYGVTATVEAPFPAGSGVDPTLSATVVDTRHRDHPGEELGDVFDEIPGTRTQASGGLGAFRGLSIRGADLSHTQVVLGHTPLSSGNGGSFDLSSLPLSLFSTVEVYRSSAPLSLTTPSIGGVVHLVPRQATDTPVPYVEGQVSVGSFGQGGLRFLSSIPNANGPSWLSVVGARHSRGNYPYLDNANTPLIASDDRTRIRQNGNYDEGYGLAASTIPTHHGSFGLMTIAQVRQGGLTGSPIEEPIHTRQRQMRLFSSVSYEHDFDKRRHANSSTASTTSTTEGRTHLFLSLSTDFQRQQVSDPFAEINVAPTQSSDRTSNVDMRAYLERALLPRVDLGITASYDFGVFAAGDARLNTDLPNSFRHRGVLGTELRLHSGLRGLRYELRAVLSLEASHSAFTEIRAERTGQTETSTHWSPTARMSFAIEPIRGLALSTSVGTATRLPSMTELFGDRAFLMGDTRLRPERSVHVDGGITLQGQRGSLTGQLDARAFGLFARSLIRYVRTSQLRLVPENISSARFWGFEVRTHGEVGDIFSITGSLSYLQTQDQQQKRELPLRPRLEAFLRPAVTFGFDGFIRTIRFYAELAHVGSNFTDPRNQVRIPPRTLLSSGIRVEFSRSHIGVSASVQDITDQRPFDLIGFPLPGRRFFVQLRLRTGAPQ